MAGGVADEEDVMNAALEFFTMENLTQMAGVGLHTIQEGTPEVAHNSIKRYLGGGPLDNPAEMKPLISILASVNRRNHSWVCSPIVHVHWVLILWQTLDKAQVVSYRGL